MLRKSESLDDLVLAAFEHAYAEKRLDVADHLLTALEALTKDDGVKRTELGPHLAQAYSRIGQSVEKVVTGPWTSRPKQDR